MLPVLTIVGRPNVGKSTLYNRLTKTRDAIVADIPGVTRDRQYGEGEYDQREFIVVDTGGIADSANPLSEMTEEQARLAMIEASIILFVVDAKAGITQGDLIIAKQLRQLENKKIVLVINKSDNEKVAQTNAEFYSLGFKDLFSIGALQNRGINDMLSRLLKDFPQKTIIEEEKKERRTRIAILGKPNVGKSTLINRLLGEERVVVFDFPGTTTDSIEIPYDRQDKKYTLIDTAGIRRRTKVEEGVEVFSVVKAIQAMRQADIVIFVIDARETVTEQDRRLLGMVVQSGNALIVAFNKWDHMSEDDRERCKSDVDRTLPFLHFARRYYISAKHGTGVGKLYDAIDEIQEAFAQKFSTHQLTEILMHATEVHQPPLAKGRRVKLRYAHVGSLRPFTLVIHGKQVHELPNSYQVFLANFFRDKLGLMGVPIIIKMIGDDNPFVDEQV